MTTATQTELNSEVQEFINGNYFLRMREADNSDEIMIISKDSFSQMNLSDTYSSYGQQISHTDAGDTHVDNEYSEIGVAWGKMNRAFDEYEEAQNNDEEFTVADEYKEEWQKYQDAIASNNNSSNINAQDWTYNYISSKYEDEIVCNTILAMNYWDGSNWQTITLGSSDFNECESMHEEIDEEEALKIATDFLEKEWSSEGFGRQYYKGNFYSFENNYCQGSWAHWYVTQLEEQE